MALARLRRTIKKTKATNGIERYRDMPNCFSPPQPVPRIASHLQKPHHVLQCADSQTNGIATTRSMHGVLSVPLRRDASRYLLPS